MGLFSKVADAKVHEKSAHLVPGLYRVKITGCKPQTSSQNAKTYAIVEMEIVTSSAPQFRLGMSASQVIDMTGIMGPVNVKKFVAAFSGIESDDPEINDKIVKLWKDATDGRIGDVEDACDLMFSDDSPAIGEEMDLECVLTKTRKGTDFTLHNWKPRKL